MLRAFLTWWRRPCVVQDLRQHLCQHCLHWESTGPTRWPPQGQCCLCGIVVAAVHGPFLACPSRHTLEHEPESAPHG